MRLPKLFKKTSTGAIQFWEISTNGNIKKWRKENKDKANAHARKSRMKNQSKIRESRKKWAEKNKEKLAQKNKIKYQQTKDMVRDQQLKRHFGISKADYDRMLKLQNGLCAICGSSNTGHKNKSFATDHDHKTGKIRGLLCRGCNVGIGNLQDDPVLLLKAANYILTSHLRINHIALDKKAA
jgi:hypothetical protein